MTRAHEINNYTGKGVEIAYAPLVFIPAEPASKAEKKLREDEARDEVRHAVNTWLYSQ